MTVVNPKSISGINSITMASGSDNLLTIHTTNTTERIRINSSGDVIVGSGITASPDGNIFATGVTTSTTFVGALTGNVTGNVTGNAGGLTGTPNISVGTIAGSTGTFTGDVDIADKIVHTGDTDTAIRFPSDNTFSVETGGSQAFRVTSNGEFVMTDSSTKTFIDLETTGNNTRAVMSLKGKTSGGGDVHLIMGGYGDTNRGEIFTYSNHDLGFATNNVATQFKCKTNGNFEIVNGDLKVASGHGIDFSATGDASGMTSELLDDYEEGTWTPALQFDVGSPTITYGTRSGTYTKIGRMVHLQYYMIVSSGTDVNDYFARLTLPYTGIGVGAQDARIRQWNTAHSDWFLSLGGSAPVFFMSNAMGSGVNYARGDDVNGHVLSGQYVLYIS